MDFWEPLKNKGKQKQNYFTTNIIFQSWIILYMPQGNNDRHFRFQPIPSILCVPTLKENGISLKFGISYSSKRKPLIIKSWRTNHHLIFNLFPWGLPQLPCMKREGTYILLIPQKRDGKITLFVIIFSYFRKNFKQNMKMLFMFHVQRTLENFLSWIRRENSKTSTNNLCLHWMVSFN